MPGLQSKDNAADCKPGRRAAISGPANPGSCCTSQIHYLLNRVMFRTNLLFTYPVKANSIEIAFNALRPGTESIRRLGSQDKETPAGCDPARRAAISELADPAENCTSQVHHSMVFVIFQMIPFIQNPSKSNFKKTRFHLVASRYWRYTAAVIAGTKKHTSFETR